MSDDHYSQPFGVTNGVVTEPCLPAAEPEGDSLEGLKTALETLEAYRRWLDLERAKTQQVMNLYQAKAVETVKQHAGLFGLRIEGER